MKVNVFQTYRDLIHQAQLLQEISHDLDPTILDMLQIAIAEDVIFFEMIYQKENRQELLDQYLTGELEIRSGTIDAARLLVDLILGEP
jgi:hypothetical protein